MNTIDAIATVAMPYGTYVEVAEDGYARPDPTYECRVGVVKRPPGHANEAIAGETIKVETEGPIQVISPSSSSDITIALPTASTTASVRTRC